MAYVINFPRQEDFGLDALCVLTRQSDRYVLPEAALYIQIKSNDEDILVKRAQANWMSAHMEHPLFICVVDKPKLRIRLYSCWRVWHGLYLWPEALSLTLRLNGTLPLPEPERDVDGISIPLGPPVVDVSLDEIEQGPDGVREVLADWTAMDARNIARRRLGRLVASGYTQWATNRMPSATGQQVIARYFYGTEEFHSQAEREVASLLTALAHNYQHIGSQAKLTSVASVLHHFRAYLDEQGREFADSRIDGDPAAKGSTSDT